MPPPRILSLLPSCTEIVWALGYGDNLVGCSHECDYPPETALLPVCTRAALDSTKPSREIERDVQSALRDALSLYKLNLPLISELKPDVILTQAQCEVCAVSLEEIERDLAEALDYEPKIVSLQPTRLAHLWDDFYTVAEALGSAEHARPVVKALKNRLVDIIQKTAEISGRPRVGCIEWTDPLMAAGNWVPDLVEMAGGACAFGQAGEHSPRLSWATLASQNPEVLVIMPCGFDLPRARAESAPLTGHPGWQGLRAVRNGKVFVVDGSHYFNRPGPRLVDSVEILAEILHPDQFNYGFRGKAWDAL
jgi:iron complex transport system substrate-binding protein